MRAIILLMALFGLLVLAALAWAGAGLANPGADVPHPAFVESLIRLVRERCVAARARELSVPALDRRNQMLVAGREYGDMCEGCHLGPGVKDNEFRVGLYPQPPILSQPRARGEASTPARAAARDFWIIKHGLAFTGMPAWGRTHDDATLWSITAFVQKLPQMSANEYAQSTHGNVPVTGNHAYAHHHHGAGDD